MADNDCDTRSALTLFLSPLSVIALVEEDSCNQLGKGADNLGRLAAWLRSHDTGYCGYNKWKVTRKGAQNKALTAKTDALYLVYVRSKWLKGELSKVDAQIAKKPKQSNAGLLATNQNRQTGMRNTPRTLAEEPLQHRRNEGTERAAKTRIPMNTRLLAGIEVIYFSKDKLE